jgi:hypothetical protein
VDLIEMNFGTERPEGRYWRNEGVFEGKFAMITIGGVPVKTRVPLTAWAFAGVLTLLSLSSSLVQLVSGSVQSAASPATHAETAAHQARVIW